MGCCTNCRSAVLLELLYNLVQSYHQTSKGNVTRLCFLCIANAHIPYMLFYISILTAQNTFPHERDTSAETFYTSGSNTE